VSGKGQNDAFTGFTPERPILVKPPSNPAASTNFLPNHRRNNFFKNYNFNKSVLGTAVAQWLRCCATNGKVAGSIPDGVIGICH